MTGSDPGDPAPTHRLVDASVAEAVLGCPELGPTLDFFTDQLGFGLVLISPADAPTTAVLDGFGLRVRLVAGGASGTAPPPGRLRLACRDLAPAPGQTVTAPNGTVIELVAAEPGLTLPPPVTPRFELSRFDPIAFGTGRAGMRYRDLLPDRQGGRFIASHIMIPDGGPVPDYVHFHRIRFQIIFCYRGWVRLVYEDQGPPFVMEAGDCVLQPPEIRHRVLEASPGLEVVEVGCPAVHDTLTDPGLDLPTAALDPDRVFGASTPYTPQRFVWHRAARAWWQPDAATGAEVSDTGIGAATGGLAGVRVLRQPTTGDGAGGSAGPTDDDVVSGLHLDPDDGAEFTFVFVLDGRARLVGPGPDDATDLGPADALALPAGAGPGNGYRVSGASADCRLLEVRLPAAGPG